MGRLSTTECTYLPSYLLWGSVLGVLHFPHASLDKEGIMVGFVIRVY